MLMTLPAQSRGRSAATVGAAPTGDGNNLWQMLAPYLNFGNYAPMANAATMAGRQSVYPQVAGIQANASKYGSQMGYQSELAKMLGNLAGTWSTGYLTNDASKYGSQQDALSSMFQSSAVNDAAKYGSLNDATASMYGSQQNALSSLYGNQLQADASKFGAQEAAKAGMYGSQQNALANLMSSYYPAAASIATAPLQYQSAVDQASLAAQSALGQSSNQAIGQIGAANQQAQAQMGTAQYAPWANAQAALAQSNAQRDSATVAALAQYRQAQLEDERKRQALSAMLSFAGGMMQQPTPGLGVSTNYGAGIS